MCTGLSCPNNHILLFYFYLSNFTVQWRDNFAHLSFLCLGFNRWCQRQLLICALVGRECMVILKVVKFGSLFHYVFCGWFGGNTWTYEGIILWLIKDDWVYSQKPCSSISTSWYFQWRCPRFKSSLPILTIELSKIWLVVFVKVVIFYLNYIL